MTMPINSLAQIVLRIAKEAGDKIMAIYENDFAIYEKQDTSPLTEADLAAHNVIVPTTSALLGSVVAPERSGANEQWTTVSTSFAWSTSLSESYSRGEPPAVRSRRPDGPSRSNSKTLTTPEVT